MHCWPNQFGGVTFGTTVLWKSPPMLTIPDMLKGIEVQDKINVTKFDPPAPQDLQTKVLLPYGRGFSPSYWSRPIPIMHGVCNRRRLSHCRCQTEGWKCNKQVNGTCVLGRKMACKFMTDDYPIFEKLYNFTKARLEESLGISHPWN